MNRNTLALSVSESPAFPFATGRYLPDFDPRHYDVRTARNRYWLGGELGQRKLRNLRIAVAGLGGMGSNIAELLVRAGVGHLRIADPDTIEVTNLNRQVIANSRTIGKTKVAASVEELRRIAQDYELVAYEQGVTEEMVEEFVEGCDAIVDEIDVFPLEAHLILHRAARRRGIPIYSSYVVGVGIHLYKFHGEDFILEDFLDRAEKELWKSPTAEYLVRKIGHPLPSYAQGERGAGYVEEIRKGTVPIFGPSTLLGQSLLTIRMMNDLLGLAGTDGPVTPCMPEFLVLDPKDLSFKVARCE